MAKKCYLDQRSKSGKKDFDRFLLKGYSHGHGKNKVNARASASNRCGCSPFRRNHLRLVDNQRTIQDF